MKGLVLKRADSVSQSLMVRARAEEYEARLKQAIQYGYSDDSYRRVSNVIDFIETQIKESRVELQRFNKAIFLMGPTGAGKSTFTNYVGGVEMVVKESESGSVSLHARDSGKALSIIGKGTGSTTIFPNIFTDIEGFEGIGFIDCAGDFESSGVIIEAINSIVRNMVAHQSKEVKFLFFTQAANLEASGSYGKNFKEFLDNAVKFLGGNIDVFRDNSAIIVSHANRKKAEANVKEKLSAMVGQPNLGKYSETIKYLVDEGRYAVFCKPQQSDDESVDGQQYKPPADLSDQREKIIDLISRKISFKILEDASVFNIPTTLPLKEAMSRAFDIVKAHAIKVLSDDLAQAMAQKIKVKNLEELKNKFEQIKAHDEENDLMEYVATLGILKEKDEYLNVEHEMKFLSSLSERNPRVNFAQEVNIHRYCDPILKDIQDIASGSERVFANKFKYDEDSKALNYYGYSAKLSEVVGFAIGKNIRGLSIYTLDSIQFDTNVSLPGCNLSIISPNWIVKTKVTIDLSGADGASHKPDKAENGKTPGDDGCDALPGLPGNGSGNFYGIGNNFDGLLNISFVLNGGKGGKGQSGGDGAVGQDGANASINEVKRAADSLLKSDVITHTSYYYSKGGIGGTGGNSGKNGAGGKGGLHGSIKIIKSCNGSKIIEVADQTSSAAGAIGENGSGAKPGFGGSSGLTAIKVYLDKDNSLTDSQNAFGTPSKVHYVLKDCYLIKDNSGVAKAPRGKLVKELNIEGIQDAVKTEDIVSGDKFNDYTLFIEGINNKLGMIGIEGFFSLEEFQL